MRLVNGLLVQLEAEANWNGNNGTRLEFALPRAAVID